MGADTIVKGTKKEPDSSDTDTLNNWMTHELNAWVQIQLTLEEEQLTRVMSAKDTKETWCKGNLTALRRILHLDLAKGNPK
jgi:hypothetical protein